jgi:hypothetical protein
MSVRSAGLLIACLLAVSPEAKTQSSQNATHPSEWKDSTETYAVYSAILAHPPLGHQDDNTKYAIADMVLLSKGEAGTPKTACAEIPQVSAESLAQIVSDFEKHGNTPVLLKRAFSLSKPYLLLSPEQASEFESRRAGHVQADFPSLPAVNPYSGAIDLIRLSAVFFDRSEKVAMVYISATCGTPCGLWGWHILEKGSRGGWQEIRTARCSATIS